MEAGRPGTKAWRSLHAGRRGRLPVSVTCIANMADTLPRDARLIALMLASSPAIADAQPAVLHQLLEFAHRKHIHL